MTFHAACARIIRRDGQALGCTPNFAIYDTSDSIRVIKRLLGKVGGFRTNSRGRYCVVWTPDGGELLVDGQEAGILSTGSRLRGYPPARCQDGDENVPWDPGG